MKLALKPEPQFLTNLKHACPVHWKITAIRLPKEGDCFLYSRPIKKGGIHCSVMKAPDDIEYSHSEELIVERDWSQFPPGLHGWWLVWVASSRAWVVCNEQPALKDGLVFWAFPGLGIQITDPSPFAQSWGLSDLDNLLAGDDDDESHIFHLTDVYNPALRPHFPGDVVWRKLDTVGRIGPGLFGHDYTVTDIRQKQIKLDDLEEWQDQGDFAFMRKSTPQPKKVGFTFAEVQAVKQACEAARIPPKPETELPQPGDPWPPGTKLNCRCEIEVMEPRKGPNFQPGDMVEALRNIRTSCRCVLPIGSHAVVETIGKKCDGIWWFTILGSNHRYVAYDKDFKVIIPFYDKNLVKDYRDSVLRDEARAKTIAKTESAVAYHNTAGKLMTATLQITKRSGPRIQPRDRVRAKTDIVIPCKGAQGRMLHKGEEMIVNSIATKPYANEFTLFQVPLLSWDFNFNDFDVVAFEPDAQKIARHDDAIIRALAEIAASTGPAKSPAVSCSINETGTTESYKINTAPAVPASVATPAIQPGDTMISVRSSSNGSGVILPSGHIALCCSVNTNTVMVAGIQGAFPITAWKLHTAPITFTAPAPPQPNEGLPLPEMRCEKPVAVNDEFCVQVNGEIFKVGYSVVSTKQTIGRFADGNSKTLHMRRGACRTIAAITEHSYEQANRSKRITLRFSGSHGEEYPAEDFKLSKGDAIAGVNPIQTMADQIAVAFVEELAKETGGKVPAKKLARVTPRGTYPAVNYVPLQNCIVYDEQRWEHGAYVLAITDVTSSDCVTIRKGTICRIVWVAIATCNPVRESEIWLELRGCSGIFSSKAFRVTWDLEDTNSANIPARYATAGEKWAPISRENFCNGPLRHVVGGYSTIGGFPHPVTDEWVAAVNQQAATLSDNERHDLFNMLREQGFFLQFSEWNYTFGRLKNRTGRPNENGDGVTTKPLADQHMTDK